MLLHLTLSLLATGFCLIQSIAAESDAQVTLAPWSAQLTAGDALVVSHYQSLFDHWKEGPQRPKYPDGCHGACFTCCNIGWFESLSTAVEGLDSTAGSVLPVNDQAVSKTVQAMPTNVRNVANSDSPPPELTAMASRSYFPVTATAMPTRTTIYRHPVQTTGLSVPGADITAKYYHLSLEGQHPDVMPLIVENADKEPVTLISVGDYSISSNFISASLLVQLNLANLIDVSGRNSEAVTQFIGPGSLSLGSIKLNLIAGRDDRRLSDVVFNVFETTNKLSQRWEIDMIVGIDFLRTAQALRLTDEYVGVGARPGLGVVVQRVFVPPIDGGNDKNQTVSHAGAAEKVQNMNAEAMIMHKEL